MYIIRITDRKFINFLQLLTILLFSPILNCNINDDKNVNYENKYPTVTIAILARNKAHTLPYFLTLLQNLHYPKDRIALWLVFIVVYLFICLPVRLTCDLKVLFLAISDWLF